VKTFVALFLVYASAWAQSGIAPPQLGFVEDGSHALRPAYGLAGNFILGPPVAANIVSEAFSGSLGLLKTDSSLAAFDSQGKLLASTAVAAGPALFAFSPNASSNGSCALVYIASSNSLLEWRGSAFAPVSLNNEELIPGAVLAIAFPSPFEASLIVQQDDIVWELKLPLGKVGTASQRALAGVRAPVLVLPSGDVVYRDAGGMVVRKPDASEVQVLSGSGHGFGPLLTADFPPFVAGGGGLRRLP